METDNRSDTARAVLLTDHNPRSVINRLPENVFPIRVKLKLARDRARDRADDEFQPPDFPVELRRPITPYIPETTVYFDNPAERPPENEIAWSRQRFCDRLFDVVAQLQEEANNHDVTPTLSELDVVEIPDQYLTTDPETGEYAAKPDLYERKGEMRIARFGKEGTLTATDVREHLEDALPGESRTPVQLVRVEEVQAKPQRLGSTTQVTGGRAQYYTETDAENTGSLELTPAIYELRSRSTAGDRTRPLTPLFPQLDDALPNLLGADELLETITFVGEQQEKTVFHAEEVRQR